MATGSFLFAEPLPAASPLAWGRGDYGQLGDGNFYTTPPHIGTAAVVQVSALTTVRAIAGGGLHSLALNADGTVWAWGDGQLGQLGDGNFYASPHFGVATPVQVSGLTTVTAIAGGYLHSLALKSDGTVWAWGRGYSGQLGDGNFYTTGNTGLATPVQVSGLTSVTAIAGGGEHSLALKTDGTVWAWGQGDFGQLGDGNFYSTGNHGVATPVQVSGLTSITAIAAGATHSLALKSDGTVWAWGGNESGQLGDGIFFIGEAAPVQVVGLSAIVAIAAGSSHNLAIQALPDGAIWAWGSGANGEVGDGNFYPGGVATPIQGSFLTSVAIACGGSHNLALLSNGSVRAWGFGEYGQLTDNSYPAALATPVSPNLGQAMRAIAAGSGHSLALPSTLPTVTIDQPADGASFAGPIDVTIEATVSDIDGGVTGVDFVNFGCNGYTPLGTVTAPPYRFTMTNLISGNYIIYVCAGSVCSVVHFSVIGPLQSLVNAATPGSTVDLPAGIHHDTVVINKNLTLRGAGARTTAIDGNNGCQPALVVTGGATVTLSDLTVTRGGIANDSTLTVNDCVGSPGTELEFAL